MSINKRHVSCQIILYDLEDVNILIKYPSKIDLHLQYITFKFVLISLEDVHNTSNMGRTSQITNVIKDQQKNTIQ